MPNQRQNVIAFAYCKRGRLLAVGRNSYVKTHRLQAHYAKHTCNDRRVYLHAELDCLLKAHRRGKIHKLVVMRIGKGGIYMLAKPCDSCQKAIKDFGVSVVEHT